MKVSYRAWKMIISSIPCASGDFDCVKRIMENSEPGDLIAVNVAPYIILVSGKISELKN